MLTTYENPMNGRYYTVTVLMDLLDDAVVTCAWGGKLRSGNSKVAYAGDINLARKYCARIHKDRIRHGYQVVTEV